MKFKERIAALLILCLMLEPVMRPVNTYANESADTIYSARETADASEMNETDAQESGDNYAQKHEDGLAQEYIDDSAQESGAVPDDITLIQEWDREYPTGASEPEVEVISVDMTLEEYLQSIGYYENISDQALETTEGIAGDDIASDTENDTENDTVKSDIDILVKGNLKVSDKGNSEGMTLDAPMAAAAFSVTESINAVPYYSDGEVLRTEDDAAVSPEGNGLFRYSQMGSEENRAVAQKIYNKALVALDSFIRSETYTQDLTDAASAINVIYEYEEGERIDSSTVKDVISALYHEAFSYYWLSSKVGSLTVTTTGVVFSLYVAPYYYSYEARQAADEAISSLVDEWYVELYSILNNPINIAKNQAEYLTALKLQDLIIERIDYAYDENHKPVKETWAHSIAGVATGQGVVCEGYAKMYSYMLNLLGIDNLYLVGMAGELHAWNAVRFSEEHEGYGGDYCLCDLTWNDPGKIGTGVLSNVYYVYTFISKSLFLKDHTPDTNLDWPAFENSNSLSFFTVFKSYSADTLTAESACTLRDSGLGNQYLGSDYVHFVVPDVTSIRLLATALDYNLPSYIKTPMGCMMLYESLQVSEPALSINIRDAETSDAEAAVWLRLETGEEAADESIAGPEIEFVAYEGLSEVSYKYTTPIEVKSTHSFTAVLPEGSDDRVSWSIDDSKVARLTTDGKTVTVTGRRGGTAVITATSYVGQAELKFSIQVGAGYIESDYVIWAGGNKDNKTVTITPTKKATNWKDSKGKDKTGKLVWVASDTDIEITFDEKHAVSGKTTKTIATVDSKGKVTAKKLGISYVYVCDTGSCTYDMYVIEVRNAPSKLSLSRTAGSSAKADLLKTVMLNATCSGIVHIVPTAKSGEPDPDCTYTVSLAKTEDAAYLSCSEVYEDESGFMCFRIDALNFDREKKKAASVKINVVNVQSGKKASMTVKIGNPVTDISVSQTDGTYAEGTTGLGAKGNTIKLKLELTSALGKTVATTDKLALYVGQTFVKIKTSGKGVEKDRGAKVSAKIDKTNSTDTAVAVELKATADPRTPALVYAAYTDSLTKQVTLYKVARIDKDGCVSLGEWDDEEPEGE